MGIERALERLLVSPQFLFRVEREPANVASGATFQDQRPRARVAPVFLSLEQHSGRRTAERRGAGTSHTPAVLERQVRRMLRDDAVAVARDELRRAVAVRARHRSQAA